MASHTAPPQKKTMYHHLPIELSEVYCLTEMNFHGTVEGLQQYDFLRPNAQVEYSATAHTWLLSKIYSSLHLAYHV